MLQSPLGGWFTMQGLKDDRKLSILETISRKINAISDYNEGLQDLLETLAEMVGAESGYACLFNYFVGRYFDERVVMGKPDDSAAEILAEISERRCPVTRSLPSSPAGYSHVGVPVIRKDNLLAAIVFRSRIGGGLSKDAIGRLSDFTEFFASHFESAVLEKVITEGFLSTIECLALALEAKDYYTIGHSNMVCAYSIAIAREMALKPKTIDEIEVGSIMHDIGKIGIDDRILKKEGRLTNEEFEIVKTHTIIGEQILMPLHKNLFQTIRMIVRNHHERMDGKGYPDGLTGDVIPLETRIVMCADAFEAMTSNRPYRQALSLEEAVGEVRRCRGTQFDPDIADVLCDLMSPVKR